MDGTEKRRRRQATPADRRGSRADERDRQAYQRDVQADERDRRADERDRRADQREAQADERDRRADQREAQADERDRRADQRERHLDELARDLGIDPVSQLRHAYDAIERSRTVLSASRERLDRNQAVLSSAQASAERSQTEASRVARHQQAQFPATLRVTMALMVTIAHTERSVAETLQDMAAQGKGKAAARRRWLAEEAIQGAHEAERRLAHLQQLARQWDEHADVITLHQLLAHAGRVLTDLARTEQEIADTFNSLASQDSSALAAQRRQLAAAAAADARNAQDRARDLHQLAQTSAARPRPQQPG